LVRGRAVCATLFGKTGWAAMSAVREVNSPSHANRALVGQGRNARSVGQNDPHPHLRALERPVIGAWSRVSNRSVESSVARPCESACDRCDIGSCLALNTKTGIHAIETLPIGKSNGNRESQAALWQNNIAAPEKI
jgi:hypothetical protein